MITNRIFWASLPTSKEVRKPLLEHCSPPLGRGLCTRPCLMFVGKRGTCFLGSFKIMFLGKQDIVCDFSQKKPRRDQARHAKGTASTWTWSHCPTHLPRSGHVGWMILPFRNRLPGPFRVASRPLKAGVVSDKCYGV